MNTKIKTLSLAAALAASVGLAGCAAGSGSSGSASHGMNHSSANPSSTSSGMPDAAAEHNQADIMFAQMMIPHHAQAVEMSENILAKQGLPAEIPALAMKIKDAQGPEIQTMTGWLSSWNVPTMGEHSGHGMSGMVDAAGMEKLKAAEGADAARLFLEQMIGHHEDAVDMAQQEIGAGKYPAAVQLAHYIVTAQEAEIAEMKQLLTTL